MNAKISRKDEHQRKPAQRLVESYGKCLNNVTPNPRCCFSYLTPSRDERVNISPFSSRETEEVLLSFEEEQEQGNVPDFATLCSVFPQSPWFVTQAQIQDFGQGAQRSFDPKGGGP